MTLQPSSTHVPSHGAIRPRRLGLSIAGTTPRHWYDGDPLVTRLLDTLSLTFPDGEKFFVDSVRHFRDRAKDEAHAADIAGFVAQEMQHSLEHAKWNRHLGTQDAAVAAVADEAEALARKLLGGARFRLSHREQLAATAALEHVTAVLAKSLLDDATLRAIDPTVKPLWMWHAVEEIEHKSVAFDLHDAVEGTHLQRRVMLVLGTIYLVAFTTHFTRRFLEADGLLGDKPALARGLWKLWGWNGLLARAVPDYVDFFRKEFHPAQHATGALLERRRAELERLRGDGGAKAFAEDAA